MRRSSLYSRVNFCILGTPTGSTITEGNLFSRISSSVPSFPFKHKIFGQQRLNINWQLIWGRCRFPITKHMLRDLYLFVLFAPSIFFSNQTLLCGLLFLPTLKKTSCQPLQLLSHFAVATGTGWKNPKGFCLYLFVTMQSDTCIWRYEITN